MDFRDIKVFKSLSNIFKLKLGNFEKKPIRSELKYKICEEYLFE